MSFHEPVRFRSLVRHPRFKCEFCGRTAAQAARWRSRRPADRGAPREFRAPTGRRQHDLKARPVYLGGAQGSRGDVAQVPRDVSLSRRRHLHALRPLRQPEHEIQAADAIISGQSQSPESRYIESGNRVAASKPALSGVEWGRRPWRWSCAQPSRHRQSFDKLRRVAALDAATRISHDFAFALAIISGVGVILDPPYYEPFRI